MADAAKARTDLSFYSILLKTFIEEIKLKWKQLTGVGGSLTFAYVTHATFKCLGRVPVRAYTAVPEVFFNGFWLSLSSHRRLLVIHNRDAVFQITNVGLAVIPLRFYSLLSLPRVQASPFHPLIAAAAHSDDNAEQRLLLLLHKTPPQLFSFYLFLLHRNNFFAAAIGPRLLFRKCAERFNAWKLCEYKPNQQSVAFFTFRIGQKYP